jgi:hypothetical protein
MAVLIIEHESKNTPARHPRTNMKRGFQFARMSALILSKIAFHIALLYRF